MIRYLILSILLLHLSSVSALPPIFPFKGSYQPGLKTVIGDSEGRHFGASASAGCRDNSDCGRRQWCYVPKGECMSIGG